MPHKPLPWYCTKCKRATIWPRTQSYEFDQMHDGRRVHIVIPSIGIPTCAQCGYQILDVGTLAKISEAVYERLDLLKPHEVRENRERLVWSQQEMQRQLGLGGNTVSRWENGHVYQSRAMDNLMRLAFAIPRVRSFLQQRRTSCEEPPSKDVASELPRSASKTSSPQADFWTAPVEIATND